MAQQQAAPRAYPIATYALILSQLAVWVIVRRYLLAGNAWTSLAMIPRSPGLLGFLVSPFVHVDPTHLAVNLLALWLFGTNLERGIGSLRFLLLYLGAAWFASLMHWAATISFHLDTDLAAQGAAIGSSGAIAGVLGASIVRFAGPRLRVPLFPKLTFPATPLIVLWLLYTLSRAVLTSVSGITEGVGHWAHFAGFVFGLGLSQFMGFQRVARVEYLEELSANALERGDRVSAAHALAALLQLRPTDARLRASLVRNWLELGDLPEARRLAAAGIEELVRKGERAAAMDSYQVYEDWLPDLALPVGVRFRIGCWLSEACRFELAFRAFYLSVSEDGRTTSAAVGLYRAGQIAWERMGNAERARATWRELVEEFPESTWVEAGRKGLRSLPPA